MHHMQHARFSNKSLIAELFQKYAPMILHSFWKRGIKTEDAEDLLLEVFIAAVENPSLIALQENEQVAWLRRVAHNKLVDHYRHQSYRQTTPLEAGTYALLESEEITPEHVIVRQESHLELWKHISKLPTTQQEVLRLRFLHGLSSKEIAQRLQKSDAAIRGQLSRAINILRTVYSEN